MLNILWPMKKTALEQIKYTKMKSLSWISSL